MMASNNAFDRLIEEIYRQKRVLEQLEEENRELRRQLIELREGCGIFVEILGLRFPLAAGLRQVPSRPALPAVAPPAVEEEQPQQAAVPVAPRVPAEAKPPEITQIRASIGPAEAQRLKLQAEGPTLAPSYLEDLLLAEFAAAAGASATVEPPETAASSASPAESKRAEQAPSPTVLDEEQKAALRRELMGSFLLE